MFSTLSKVHKGKAITWLSVVKAVPALVATPAGEVPDGAGELLGAGGVEASGDDVGGGGGTLLGVEEADFVEESGAADVEGGDDGGVGVGLEEGVADLGGDHELVLLDAGDAGGFLKGGRSEAFLDEGGDDGGIVEPEAEAVGEDFEAAVGVEGTELGGEGRRRWPERLVDLLLFLGRCWVRRDVAGGDGFKGGFCTEEESVVD